MAYWFKYTYSHEQAHFSYVYGTTDLIRHAIASISINIPINKNGIAAGG